MRVYIASVTVRYVANPGTTKGFAVLRGWGASSLMDLPALPYCARLPAAARSRVIGCP
jgi:hypothetical protein